MTLEERAWFLGWDEGLEGRHQNPFSPNTPEGRAWIDGYVEATLERTGAGHSPEWLESIERRRHHA